MRPYFEDKGPIFYNATRRGRNGKNFKMFKLRSMYVNSPDLKNPDGSTFNSDKDPRVTKIGRIMRKTSIDELPQILNVLLGHMSFIGPRPTLAITPYEELPESEKEYDRNTALQTLRLIVKLGYKIEKEKNT